MMGVPKRSDWVSMETKAANSSISERAASDCQASRRGLPARCSRLTWGKLFVDLRVREGELRADAEQGLIKAEAGIHADDEQVDGNPAYCGESFPCASSA